MIRHKPPALTVSSGLYSKSKRLAQMQNPVANVADIECGDGCGGSEAGKSGYKDAPFRI